MFGRTRRFQFVIGQHSLGVVCPRCPRFSPFPSFTGRVLKGIERNYFPREVTLSFTSLREAPFVFTKKQKKNLLVDAPHFRFVYFASSAVARMAQFKSAIRSYK